ncbi:MAG: polyprenol monophosphomannose synthase [Marmoricola sp.]
MPPALLMVVPTYNEADNISWLVGRILAAAPWAHVLVVDDSSPDGTGDVAERLAWADDHVFVLHRPTKEGLGKAYLAGFRWAMDRDYEVVGEIDADGSHQPEQLPELLEALKKADLVIGSRWVPGGKVTNQALSRRLLSRGGNLYTRLLLGIPVRDATAGYRLFRRTTLERVHLDDVSSMGYVFQVDLAVRTLREGLRVVEVPIEFVERERGDSKMTPSVATESLRRITLWGLRERRDQLRRSLRRPRNNAGRSYVDPS